jgi:serine/threonine protein kinase/dipeptidyl aminopeptidase/acylaminoacyl peptidase
MSAVEIIGRYEVKRKIGVGGMGEVYLAFDPELNREVAVKVLLPEFCSNTERVNRFKLEAKAASALNHPNIITIYEVGSHQGTLYIATEYIKGETLRSLINRHAVTFDSALEFAQQIAGALNSAHKEGIVHRDIKPENIMVREDGILKVLDFGLAKPTQVESEAKTLDLVSTKAGMVMGSVGYMSPEQARGKEVDIRTDIWSLGVVLYEMVTGKAPFDGETMTDILANIIHKDPISISEYVMDAPAELHRIIKKALRKNREERYQTAKDFALDLKSLHREFEHSGSIGFLTGPHAIAQSPTTAVNLHTTEDAKTLIHQTTSAEVPDPTKTSEAKTYHSAVARRRNWWIPVGVAAMACLIALGAWFYRPAGSTANVFDSLQISTISGSEKAFAPAISPDGKYLGYINYENGRKSLVVRQIATGSTVSLVTQVENEGFMQPTFSPDGNYVYYVLADKGVGTLYSIPTLGGSPKKLINDVDSKVSFSPDGKELAYRRRDAQTGVESIFIAGHDGTNERALVSSTDLDVKGFNEVAWVPSGEALLVGGIGDILLDELIKSKLMIVSIADKTARRFGEREWINANSFYWTKNGAALLMLAKSNDQEPAQIWQLSFPDGGDARRITNDSSGYEMLSFAPESNTLTAAKQNTISSLWSYTPANRELAQITTDNRNLLGATGFEFLPDGRFLLSKIEANKANLISLSPDGRDEKALTSDESFNGQAVVSPDGKYIVYTSSRGRNLSVWRIDPDGKNLVQLTNPDTGYDSKPQISADGKTVIFERRTADFTRSALMKIPIEGGEPVPFVADDKQLQIFPRLSDDRKLFVYSTMNFDRANTRFDRSVKVYSMNGGQLGELKREFKTHFGNNYRFTPDGKNLTFVNLTGVPNIYNVPLDGTAPKQITNFNSGHIINFAWSKDGKKLYIVRAIINSELVLLRNNAKG